MKRICICLIVLMGILSQLNAQEQLKKSTNIPRPNDAIFKQQVEYKNPGKSGKNVFWNFGELNAINKNIIFVIALKGLLQTPSSERNIRRTTITIFMAILCC